MEKEIEKATDAIENIIERYENEIEKGTTLMKIIEKMLPMMEPDKEFKIMAEVTKGLLERDEEALGFLYGKKKLLEEL